jgi:hypothetical protein
MLHMPGTWGPIALAQEGEDHEGGDRLIVRMARGWSGERFQTFEGFPVEWYDD